MLPTTFDENGCASSRQHLCCFVIDDSVTVDAGSLAMAVSELQRDQIRNIVLTHAHLDHIAGLPLFVDDLFAVLKSPICVYAEQEVIEILERDVFNWSVYPRFSELENEFGQVLKYHPFQFEQDFQAGHLTFKAVAVNHKVPSSGLIISDNLKKIAITGDTAETDNFWQIVNKEKNLDALFIECAFPNKLSELAFTSHHLTPLRLKKELEKFTHKKCPIFVINLKPMYHERIIEEINELKIDNLEVLKVGSVYDF